MEGELFQGGVLMHSYLRAVGFSRITKRSSIRQIITDVVETYDEKTVIENYPDGMFAEFSKNYGCDCGITVCGQYDENNVFYPDYYFPFFRGTGITTQESVVIERHADKESFAGACDDLRIGVTLIFYLQNAAEYLQQREKGNILPGGQPLTLSGLAREGKILFPVEKDKEAVKAERELTKNRNHLIAAARNGDEDAMESLTMEDMDTQILIIESKALITDYSSIYIDYLLLDKPLLFYCYDYEHYLENDREMYFNYEDVTPGNKAKNFDELFKQICGVIENGDDYGRKEREINLKNAFKTSTNALELKKVLLVDDIYTTGVTMDEAAKVLWMAGAEEVHFLVLCTGKPDC